MSAQQLWDDSEMDRPATTLGSTWLFWTDIGEANLARLSWLARVDARQLASIAPPLAWSVDDGWLPFCYDCLMCNQVDVTAPRWKYEWLEPRAAACRLHDAWYRIKASTVRNSSNFNHLLASIRSGHGFTWRTRTRLPHSRN